MRKIGYILLCSLAAIACGCDNSHGDTTDYSDSDIVAQYRDTILRMSDVVRMLPPDISSADSLRLANSIIDQWVDGFIIEDLAAGQIDDMDRIERLTQDYRRSLIAESFRRKARTTGMRPVDQKKVTQYYRDHRHQLILERPIIKGLFIKVPASSRYLADIRNWMMEAGASDFDQLENIGRKETTSFRFFADQWVDFDAISSEIPYRFGDSDKFVEATRDFETEHNGMVYILHINDFRLSGGLMPEEYATPVIIDIISNSNLADYEKSLIKALRETAIEKKILTIGNFTK